MHGIEAPIKHAHKGFGVEEIEKEMALPQPPHIRRQDGEWDGTGVGGGCEDGDEEVADLQALQLKITRLGLVPPPGHRPDLSSIQHSPHARHADRLGQSPTL